MKLLSRDEILRAQDIGREQCDVAEWGGTVLVQGGSAEERDAFEASIMTGKGKDRDVNTKRLRVKLLAASLVDEHGARLFTEADVDALSKKSAKVVERLFKVAQRLWGLDPKDVEDLVGESKPGQKAGLATDSPGNGVSAIPATSAVN